MARVSLLPSAGSDGQGFVPAIWGLSLSPRFLLRMFAGLATSLWLCLVCLEPFRSLGGNISSGEKVTVCRFLAAREGSGRVGRSGDPGSESGA